MAFKSLRSVVVKLIVITGPLLTDTFPPVTRNEEPPADVPLVKKNKLGLTELAETDSENVRLSTPLLRSRVKSVSVGGTVSMM